MYHMPFPPATSVRFPNSTKSDTEESPFILSVPAAETLTALRELSIFLMTTIIPVLLAAGSVIVIGPEAALPKSSFEKCEACLTN